MTRRLWVLLSVLSLLLSSCAREVKAPELPRSVSPGWELKGIEETGPHFWTARYGGVGSARVQIWAVHGSAEGLERMQKWQAVANTVVFYGEHYFTAVDWTGVDRMQAGTLVNALERAIGVPINHAR